MSNELKDTNQQPKVKIITISLLMGLILASIDQTIVSTAMPTIIKQLDGLSLYSWVFTIYMLASTTTIPVYGKLADLFGRRNVYLIGLSLFLIGSVLCGFAGSMTQLIVFRGIQGLGAGALMPIAFTIVGDLYPPESRGKFMGLFSAVFSISSILGPVLGGMISEHLGWGWIFSSTSRSVFRAFTLWLLLGKKASAIRDDPSIGPVLSRSASLSSLFYWRWF